MLLVNTNRIKPPIAPIAVEDRCRADPRPPSDVVAGIRHLLAQGIEYLHLCDSEFNLPAAHAAAVCQAIINAALGEKLRWYTNASPAAFSRKLAGLMRLAHQGFGASAGCVGINFGVDSGCDRMLAALLRDLIGKDERFFLPVGGDEQDYNYNDNTVLQRAIEAGHRGAYWDILRKLANDERRGGVRGRMG